MSVDKITPDDSRISHCEANLNGQTYRMFMSLARLWDFIKQNRLHTWCSQEWEFQGDCVSHPRMARPLLWLAIPDTVPDQTKYASRGPRHDGIWWNSKLLSTNHFLCIPANYPYFRMLHAHRLLTCAFIPSNALQTISRSWPSSYKPLRSSWVVTTGAAL